MPFKLPPDSVDLMLPLSVSRDLLPYMLEWYQDKKNGSESPAQFALRMLKEMALTHRRAKEQTRVAAAAAERSKDDELELASMNSDFSSELERL